MDTGGRIPQSGVTGSAVRSVWLSCLGYATGSDMLLVLTPVNVLEVAHTYETF